MKILADLRMGHRTFARERDRRGIPPRRNISLPGALLAERYRAGESVLALAEAFDVSRSIVRRHLEAEGVELRSHGAAGLVRAARECPQWRRDQLAAARAAAGKYPRDAEAASTRRAITRENLAAQTGRGEILMHAWLLERGLPVVAQKAVGKYNVDLAVTPVAVEILGGGWHAAKASHGVRTPYILNQGWNLAMVWNYEGRSALTEHAADSVVAYLQEVRRDPAATGQYRVISGDGETLATGSVDGDEYALVPPPRSRERGRPTYDGARWQAPRMPLEGLL
jgi:DNA-binding transcriptional ArsR family regulator